MLSSHIKISVKVGEVTVTFRHPIIDYFPIIAPLVVFYSLYTK